MGLTGSTAVAAGCTLTTAGVCAAGPAEVIIGVGTLGSTAIGAWSDAIIEGHNAVDAWINSPAMSENAQEQGDKAKPAQDKPADGKPAEGKKDDAVTPPADKGKAAGETLPDNPDDLLNRGYKDTSHPDAAKAGHRTFENPETGDKIRHDAGKPGEPGHEGQDHYHRYNPDATGKLDKYLDKSGNPTSNGSGPSHLYPGD